MVRLWSSQTRMSKSTRPEQQTTVNMSCEAQICPHAFEEPQWLLRCAQAGVLSSSQARKNAGTAGSHMTLGCTRRARSISSPGHDRSQRAGEEELTKSRLFTPFLVDTLSQDAVKHVMDIKKTKDSKWHRNPQTNNRYELFLRVVPVFSGLMQNTALLLKFYQRPALLTCSTQKARAGATTFQGQQS